MYNTGYYEIMNQAVDMGGCGFRALAGNVMFNRLHWHDSLEIICCIYGSINIKIQDCSYMLHEGDLVTINPGVCHELSEGTKNGLQLMFLVDKSLLRISESEEYLFTTVGDAPLSQEHEDVKCVRSSIASLSCLMMPNEEEITRLYDVHQEVFHDEQIMLVLDTEEKWYQAHIELYKILTGLSRHKKLADLGKPISGSYCNLVRCVEIIHNEYGYDLNIKAVAARLGFSVVTIYRLFQKHMGISFNHYLNSVRVSAACGLIEKSNFNITEIAEHCGFSSISNFYRVFQLFVGIPPREYKKLYGTNISIKKRGQRDLLSLNRFQPFWELPYTKADIRLAVN